MTITVKADLRASFGPARDQGKRPTCLAFATSDAHAAMRGNWSPLSCEFAFYHAQRRANRLPHQGATLPTMLTAIREDGQPNEAGWPYLAVVPTDLKQWVPPPGATPLYKRAGGLGADTVDAIIAELAQGRPVITLMRLSNSFFRINADGIVDEAPGDRPDLNIRHAVVSVGHGELKRERVVLIRNSWGAGWGAHGYGWVTEKFLRPRVFRLAILKEDLSVSPNPLTA
jgi:C1A family cysteine protease